MIEQSQSIKSLASALLQAQSELGGVTENATNPFFKSKYADLGEHIKTIKPAFEKHGLVISQFVSGDGDEIGVTTMLMHESGEWLKSTATIPLEQEKGNSKAQTAGKAISYLRRYALAAVANVYSGDDDDGNIEQPKKKATSSAQSNGNNNKIHWSPEFVQEVRKYNPKVEADKHAVQWLDLVKPKTLPHIKLLMPEYLKYRNIDKLKPADAAEKVQELNV